MPRQEVALSTTKANSKAQEPGMLPSRSTRPSLTNENLQDLNIGEEHQVVLNGVAFQPVTPCKRGGVRYNLSLYSWSNLRMKADVHTSILEPGSKFTVRAHLDEFDVRFNHAKIGVELTYPDGTSQQMSLSEATTGAYEGATQADMPGVRVTASGLPTKAFPLQEKMS
jgi:hypothetical protein